MHPELAFFIEVLIAGLLSGVMYSLVALGFVLIFKASGIFNFAQGAMVLFAALTFVRILEMGVNFWLAIAIALAVRIVMAVIIERVMLRPLVAQPVIILFMATIGLNYFIEGFAQAVWDADVHGLDVGIPDVPWMALLDSTNILVSLFSQKLYYTKRGSYQKKEKEGNWLCVSILHGI